MFFRNLTLFRFSPALAASLTDLETALARHALRPCGPLESVTRGFVSPFGPESDALSHRIGDAILFTLGAEEKLLPSAVLNAELGIRLRKAAAERLRGHQKRLAGAGHRLAQGGRERLDRFARGAGQFPGAAAGCHRNPA